MGRAPSDQSAADAFGVEQAPFWRRSSQHDSAAPKRVTKAVAAITAVFVLIAPSVLHGHAAKYAAIAALAVPGYAVERYYRARRRRRREELLAPTRGS